MNDLPDPLLEFLMPPALPNSSELRQSLRQKTSGLVRRRRYARRLAIAASLAACLLLTLAALYVIDQFRDQTAPVLPNVVEIPKPVDAPAVENIEKVETTELVESPVALEWRAFDDQTDRATAYFLAGNKYLEASQDMESALRCYAQALDACRPEQLEIVPDDNWLVIALKNSRRKELVHD